MTRLSPAPYRPEDALVFLEDFGKTLECVAVPSVTRGLVDVHLMEHRLADGTSTSQLTVLKVKAGAFGNVSVLDTRVTVIDDDGQRFLYKIVNEVPHEQTIFDWYALELLVSRPA